MKLQASKAEFWLWRINLSINRKLIDFQLELCGFLMQLFCKLEYKIAAFMLWQYQELHCLTLNLLSNYHHGHLLQVIAAEQGNKYSFSAKKKDSSSEAEYPARLRHLLAMPMPAEQTGAKSRTWTNALLPMALWIEFKMPELGILLQWFK